MKFPSQPIIEDDHGVPRFKANKVVQYLLDHGGLDMNALADADLPQEDRIQFAQLIGYSLGGFGELSYVTNDAYEVAHQLHGSTQTELEAKVEVYETLLTKVREQVKVMVPELFKIHPDDLKE